MMKPSKPPIRAPEKLQEAVTAYLDGELDLQAAREIEERLARDAPFRTELQRLQQSWELLEELPRVEADPHFAATTVEMVAVTARDDATPRSPKRGATLLRQAGILLGATLAACVLGFLATSGVTALFKASGLIRDADDQLLGDLPVLQNLDKYLLAEDVQFLRALHERPPAAAVPADQRTALVDAPREERRAQVERMSPQERSTLAINRQRFATLAPPEQEKLRRFHQQLMRADEREQLAGTLDAFYQWYKQLAPEHRAELRGRPAEQRLAYIDQLSRRQAEQQPADELSSADGRSAGSRQRASGEQLMAFFGERLSREQQERMKRLPRDEFMRVLRREYLRSHFGGQRPRPHGDETRHPRPPEARPFPRRPGPLVDWERRPPGHRPPRRDMAPDGSVNRSPSGSSLSNPTDRSDMSDSSDGTAD